MMSFVLAQRHEKRLARGRGNFDPNHLDTDAAKRRNHRIDFASRHDDQLDVEQAARMIMMANGIGPIHFIACKRGLAIELEGQCYGRLRSSEDFREGVEAFGAKRKPSFRGR